MRPEHAARPASDFRTAEVTYAEDASHFVPGDRPDGATAAILRPPATIPAAVPGATRRP